MKKFSVDYYTCVYDESKELEVQKIVTEQLEAEQFFENGGIFFTGDNSQNVAYFSNVISVKEIK